MNEYPTFRPNWASPPGDTIIDILEDNNLSITKFSQLMELAPKNTKRILRGELSISSEMARKLEQVLGGKMAFWVNRDAQYRNDLDHVESLREEIRKWVNQFPLRDMVKFGWVEACRDLAAKEKALLKFFNVKSVRQWYTKYSDFHLEAAYRTSSSFDSKPESIVTWLRQGEILCEKNKCYAWDKDKFGALLLEVRKLTRIKDPAIFIPELQSKFAQCGVNLIVLRTPSRCRASGAAFYTTGGEPAIILSFRYLSDDHFWFSLFHEAGHILLHKQNQIFIDTSAHPEDGVEEDEANEFSANILIPPEYKDVFLNLRAKQWKDIVRFAKKIGVSAGIVVGQLQFLGVIGPNQLNGLKTRFKWVQQ